MKQICDLAHCSESISGIILSCVQQQLIGVDCSLFAIAFAVDILNRLGETRKCFDVGTVRSHLLKCLEEEEFTLCLRSHRGYQRGTLFT